MATNTNHNGVEVVKQVREIVRDLMPHRASIYWTDFLISYAFMVPALYLTLTTNGWIKVVSLVVTAILMYRLSIFTHELAHMTGGQFKLFRKTWNLMFGIPSMMPLFLYGDHKSHHVNHSYGTEHDGEYFPLAHGPIHVIFAYFGQIVILPIAAIIRFTTLGPLSLLIPPLRTLVWQKFSGLVTINPKYSRPDPKPQEKLGIVVQELLTSLWVWTFVALLITGVIPLPWLLTLYCLFVVGSTMNFYRALGAHRYVNEGEPMSYLNQLLDSTTIESHLIVGDIIAPLGMRFHALHHLVPSLPYHAMPAAHRRLMEQLPEDSPYRDTIYPSLTAAVFEVVRNAWRRGPQDTKLEPQSATS